MGMRPTAQHRLDKAPRRRRADLAAPSAWRKPRVVALDHDLDPTLRARPGWRARATWDRRVPGLGPGWARTLLRDRPELGPFSRQRLAARVGVAPCKRDSGPLRGPRTTWGGRAQGRAPLSMRTLVAVRSQAVRRAVYQRRCAAGKATQVALTACMRKLWPRLKALVKHQQPWHVQEVLSA